MTLHVSGTHLVAADGTPVRLRGVGLGGWMNMENFITGYPANESAMREAVAEAIGEERAELFFDRLLTSFFGEADAALLSEIGMNCVRIPVNYRHFESDDRPLEIIEHGFRHLDRVIDLLGRHGIYSVIDLHAVPGAQNQHWHSDNPTHVASFWRHRHFQDRVVHLWEVMADRYRDNPWVAGYNPVNEPGDSGGRVVGPFYDRLVKAVRAADPHHVLFLDGNTYSTDFSVFRELYENTVFVCHDYALAGFAHGGPYPGHTRGEWVDRAQLERTFERRTVFQRQTGTPLWVGSSAPSTPATRRSTSSATRSSATSWRSTTPTGPAGRCGPTRTSGSRAWRPRTRPGRTWSASGRSSPRRRAWAPTGGAPPWRNRPTSSRRCTGWWRPSSRVGPLPVGRPLPDRRPDPAHPHRAGAASRVRGPVQGAVRRGTARAGRLVRAVVLRAPRTPDRAARREPGSLRAALRAGTDGRSGSNPTWTRNGRPPLGGPGRPAHGRGPRDGRPPLAGRRR
nr:hypothetical protein GCM10020093_042410 [Planobispora longispora]